jgi:hypothetical protein
MRFKMTRLGGRLYLTICVVISSTACGGSDAKVGSTTGNGTDAGPGAGGASVAGAGGTSAGGTVGTGGTTVAGNGGGSAGQGNAAAIRQLAEANCALIRRCQPSWITWDFGTEANCIQRAMLDNNWSATLPGIPDNFSSCAAAYAVATCDDLMNPGPLTGCEQPGTHAIGEGCNENDQCVTRFCKQTGWSCGQCAAAPAPGSACKVDTDCAEGTWCMSSGTCKAPSKLGEACSDTLKCRSPLNCHSGKCEIAPSTTGAACDAKTGLFCDWTHDLICSGTTCVAYPPHKTGEVCDANASYCAELGTCTNGVCQARPSDTGACDDATRKFCEWPATCVAGACQLPTNATLCASSNK